MTFYDLTAPNLSYTDYMMCIQAAQWHLRQMREHVHDKPSRLYFTLHLVSLTLQSVRQSDEADCHSQCLLHACSPLGAGLR